ncbi:MAG TPA: CoA transferase [Hyphomonadaceae bacterium]|jgi:crotonobetainyl-CoA:carnitine CoA-transferase CaiB-like acyl-CoA transferase|nr:CoA transferase [Hyphomonadaceae bacterium]
MALLGSPLDGLKVLDFSRVLAGPFASRMLCDLGAEVVKVEPPEGDSTRLWGKMTAGISGYFNIANAGKQSISIDLRAAGAQELVLQLAAKADVVIENFRPDVMPRLGIGYERLAAVNPRLVMLSISGFGRDGPESARPAYAPIVHAELGLIDRVMRRDGAKVDLPLSVADTNAGLHGIIALLSALLMRDRTGLGQHIDMSMMDATLVSDDQLHFEIEDAEATRNLPPDIWETGAGAILVSVDFRYLWKLLTTSFGVAEPALPGMDLNAKILARRNAVAAFMKSLVTWDQVEAAMAQMNLAWGRVRTGKALREQPTLAHRGSIAEIDDRAGGTRPIAQSPYRFSQAKSEVRGPAPYRGEHNEAVLHAWLGKSHEDVTALTALGVLTRDNENAG